MKYNPPPPPPPRPPTPGAPDLPPLVYATPVARVGDLTFDLRTALWSAGVLGVWAVLVMMVVPRVEEVFTDFKVQASFAARLMFQIGGLLSRGLWVLALVIPVALGFACGRLSPGARWAVRMILTVIFAGLVVFALLALLVPLLDVIQGISGS